MFVTAGLILLAIVSTIYLYCRLTCGISKCSKHLVGKVVIVTGSNTGIGYEAAKDFADRGAKVILACRSEQRGMAAKDKIISETGNKDVHFKKLDLASFASVRAFAEDVNKNEERLDILVNNAGIIMGTKKEITEDGLLVGMQTNHFGPFLLTKLLLNKVKSSAPSRIINVSSDAHNYEKMEFDNINMEKETSKIDPFVVYSNSKLCNILMSIELAKQLKGTGVTVNVMCPGAVATSMAQEVTLWWFALLWPVLKYIAAKSPWEGAQTIIHLAVSPQLTDVSGKYFRDCAEAKSSKMDMNRARKLWEVSEKACKVE